MLATLILEALAIGLARKRWRPVVTSSLYWGVIGLPAQVLRRLWVLDNASEASWLVSLRQIAFSIGAAALVPALVRWSWSRRWIGEPPDLTADRPLRAHLGDAFLALSVLPLLALAFISSRNYALKARSETSYRLEEAAVSVRSHLDDYLTRHVQAVAAAAAATEHAGKFDRDTLNGWLERYHTVYDSFHAMFVADRDGLVIGAHPLITHDGREYFSTRHDVKT